MKIGNWFRALEWTKPIFGKGWLDRYVVWENKYLTSAYVNFWHVKEHDRFHRHAFAAISIGIKGGYKEEILEDDGNITLETHAAPWVRFIPRRNNHRMLESTPGAISVTIAGPWDAMWSETFLDGTVRILRWGRKELLKYKPSVG